MKHLILVTVLAAVAASLLVTHSIDRTQAQSQSVFFGFLVGTPRIAAVALDLGAPDANGQRVLRAYVCDGLGPPAGIAIWFRGSVTGEGSESVSLTSVGGQEKLVITAMTDRGVYGAFTDADGAVAHFAAYPGMDGAGIYQVTLDEALHYRGTSTDGAVLDAQAGTDGRTSGTITVAGRPPIGFTVRSLALATPALLSEHGLSQDFLSFVSVNQVPGEYTAVIAPGGSHWLGRSGSVQSAEPGAFIIGLDKKEAVPTTRR